MSESFFDGLEPIYSYSRAQAIADGVLVDCTDAAKRIGFKVHFVVTETVSNHLEPDKEGFSQRLNLLLLLAHTTAREKHDESRFEFKATSSQREPFILDIGPGDEGEPVLTLGFPGDF